MRLLPISASRLSFGVRVLLFLIVSMGACSDGKTPIRVACVGDSITFGHKIKDRETLCYPAQLQKILGKEYEVRCFAENGLTLMKSGDLPVWESSVLDEAVAFLPDIVVVQLGSNDAKRKNWKRKEGFVRDYLELLRRFQNLPSKPVILIAHPTPSFPTAFGIDNALMEAELLPMISEVAEKAGVLLIDVHTAFLEHGEWFPDQLHPDENGAAKIAEIVSLPVKDSGEAIRKKRNAEIKS